MNRIGYKMNFARGADIVQLWVDVGFPREGPFVTGNGWGSTGLGFSLEGNPWMEVDPSESDIRSYMWVAPPDPSAPPCTTSASWLWAPGL